MKLSINKSYNLFTKKETIAYKKVKVLGILNYEEAQSIADSIYQLAINETVIDTEDTANYLEKQIYYKLLTLDGTNTHLVCWDDVIDFDKTTELNVDFNLLVTVNINANSSISIDDIKNSLSNALIRDFDTKQVSGSVRVVGTSESSSISESVNATEDLIKSYESLLSETKDVLEIIIAQENKANAVYTKMESLSNLSNLDNIQVRLSEIKETVEEIYNLTT